MSHAPDPDRRLDELLHGFRTPPPPDAGGLWARIEPELAQSPAPRARVSERPRRVWPMLVPSLATAAVALTVLLARTGREPSSRREKTPVASERGTTPAAPGNRQIREAVDEHLAATERFLRPVLAPGNPPAATAPTIASDAADLLAQNALLLASSSVAGAPQRRLLEDVELVLTQLAVDGSAGFAEMTAGDVRLLDRLRAAAGEEGRSE